MPPPRRPRPLITDPLSRPVTRAEARAAARHADAVTPWTERRTRRWFLIALIVVFVLWLLIATPTVIERLTRASDFGDVSIALVFIVIPLIGIAVPARRWRRQIDEDRRRVRLAEFAKANRWEFEYWAPATGALGMAFADHGDQNLFDVLRTRKGDLEFGRYRSVINSRKPRIEVHTQYVTFEVPAVLPHIVLDSKANDRVFGRSNLRFDPVRTQQLDLEGDFPQHFRLYCPEGYEVDALHLLPPDIMLMLLTHACALDVELSGSTVRLYAPKGIITTDAESWTRLLATVAAIREMARQWAGWRDDRVSSPAQRMLPPEMRPLGVAPEGSRLRTRLPWLAIIIAVAGLVAWLMSLFPGR